MFCSSYLIDQLSQTHVKIDCTIANDIFLQMTSFSCYFTIDWKNQRSEFLFSMFIYLFIFYQVFLSQTLATHRAEGEGEGGRGEYHLLFHYNNSNRSPSVLVTPNYIWLYIYGYNVLFTLFSSFCNIFISLGGWVKIPMSLNGI